MNAGWPRSVPGGRLHQAICVSEVRMPLAARLTLATAAGNEVAPSPIEVLPDEAPSCWATSTRTRPTQASMPPA